MKKSWFKSWAAVIWLAVVLASPTFSRETPGRKVFEIRAQTQVGFNEYFIAEKLGYFKAEGIRLKYIGVLRPGTELAAVASGHCDVFSGHPNTVALAILAGAKLKIVAPGIVDHPTYPHMVYLVRQGGPVQSTAGVRRLKRKVKVAVSAINSCGDLLFYEWLRLNHLPDSKAEFVIMPDKEQEQVLEQGLVDVICLHPQYWKRAVENPKLRKLATTWEITNSPGAGASIRGFSERFLREHPNEVRGFVRALIKAQQWINANLDQSIGIVARRLQLKPIEVTAFWYDENHYIQEAYIKQWFDMMYRHGQLKKGQLQPSDIYTNNYNPYYLAQKAKRPKD